jgi:hypothetical protein
VDHLLKRVEMTFAAASREKGLRLRVVSSGAFIRSDSILLERILLNLVSNAVRYTVHGGVIVGCRCRGGALRIEVRGQRHSGRSTRHPVRLTFSSNGVFTARTPKIKIRLAPTSEGSPVITLTQGGRTFEAVKLPG